VRPAPLTAEVHVVLLDVKAANAREIDRLIVRVAARGPESIEVLGARPALEDVDASGIHGIRRNREVQASRCLAREAHRARTRHDVRVAIGWIEDEVTSDDDHESIVPTDRFRLGRAQAGACPMRESA